MNEPRVGRIIYLDANAAYKGGLGELGYSVFRRTLQFMLGVLLLGGVLAVVLYFVTSLVVVLTVGRTFVPSFVLVFEISCAVAALALIQNMRSRRAAERRHNSIPLPPFNRTPLEIRAELERYRSGFGGGLRRGIVWGLLNLAAAGVLFLGVLNAVAFDGHFITLRTQDEPLASILSYAGGRIGPWGVVLLLAAASATLLFNAMRMFSAGPTTYLAAPLLRLITTYVPFVVFLISFSTAMGLLMSVLMLASPLLPSAIAQNQALGWAAGFPLGLVGLAALWFGSWFVASLVGGFLDNAINRRISDWHLPSTANALWDDRRQPIVLLRSFQDDTASIDERGEDGKKVTTRLEDEISRVIRRCYGPFLAIAQPSAPKVSGAARDYAAGEAWRARVIEWMDAARFIIVIAGWTEGLQWEMSTVLERGHLNKLVLLFPPDPKHAKARWAWIQHAFRSLPWSAAINEVDANTARVAFACPDGAMMVVKGTDADKYEFEAALHLAVYGLLVRGAEP